MNKFILLKRTYPKSKYDRYCDGYDYIINNSSIEQRKLNNIDDSNIIKKISAGEKYIYQVGKEKDEFKVMHISFKNYKIIRKLFFGESDE